MSTQPDPDAVLDTIATLAMDIARQCPDCADSASQIASLAGEVRGAGVDRGAVQDALDSQMADSGMSDLQVRSTTEAVIKAAKNEA